MSSLRCSIVMSTYNKADLLDLSLQSIRQQDIPFKYEIIVIDDGSDDHTHRVCRHHEVRYEYLDRPYYANPGKARNIGLKMAESDVIIQQCEVIHHTPDTIEKLASRAEPGFLEISTVHNAFLHENGTPTPQSAPFAKVNPGEPYTGEENKRPLFFLGAAMRSDLFAVGGNDEEFTEPCYEDTWLADCLITGRGCQVRFWSDIQAFHLDHDRPSQTNHSVQSMLDLYERKVKSGTFVASGGAWTMDSFAV